MPYIRHSRLYFSDGNVYFLVGDTTLFKLHRSFLSRNPESALASLLKGPSNEPQGTSEDHPITLPGIDAEVFAKLARVLYATNCGILLDPGAFTGDEWLAIIELAEKYSLSVIQHLARAMQKVSPVNMDDNATYLLIACNHISEFSREYIEDLFFKLCNVPIAPLSIKQSEILGSTLARAITNCRFELFERYRSDTEESRRKFAKKCSAAIFLSV